MGTQSDVRSDHRLEILDQCIDPVDLVKKRARAHAVEFGNRDRELEVLLNAPFESSEELIERSLDLCKLLGFSQADGDYFSFASRSEEDFLVIEEPLSRAVNLIESS